MDLRRRMELMAESALADREGVPQPRRPSGLAGPAPVGKHPLASVGIAAVRLPGGSSTNLMRVMQTNACSLSCGYCPTFCGGNVRRTAITPEETARTFMDVNRRGLASGLFLTSGVPGRPARATDRMLATLDVLRRREGFEGYIHLKLLPGAEPAQVEEAARLANRVSVNLEAPGDVYVHRLTRDKSFSGDLLPKLEHAGRLLAARRGVPGALPSAGTTTQFVVGAAGERDSEILGVVDRLERRRLLHHAHFSAFQPVAGTPLEHLPATPAARELRLYQAEHLLRHYGFALHELAFGADGNLDLDRDPKTAWARAHPGFFPLEITRAPWEALLRVPGLGPTTARALVAARGRTVLRDAGDLRRAGVDTVRAGYYLALRGRRLAPAPPPEQMWLFAPGAHLTQAPFKTPVPPCAYR
jgi:predicted DNA-binding helix-hairpin-helix protein